MHSDKQHIHVKIAEVRTGRGNKILKTTLGSCVGIAFLWKERNYYGLAHCLLPETPHATTQIGAKYVNQAIPSLLAMMKIAEPDRDQIRAVVIGGGNMMVAKQDEKNHIGMLNTQAAVRILKEIGIKIVHEDTGGNEATQFSLDCSTGEYKVSRIAKQRDGVGYGI